MRKGLEMEKAACVTISQARGSHRGFRGKGTMGLGLFIDSFLGTSTVLGL